MRLSSAQIDNRLTISQYLSILHDYIWGLLLLMVEINPLLITGNWKEGYALDLHTLKSEFIGYDEFGNEKFETQRSPLGELLYRFKYRDDRSALAEISDTMVQFIRNRWLLDTRTNLIIPVPPSNTARSYQPVIALSERIGRTLQIAVSTNALIKIKETDQLKSLDNYEARISILHNAFKADNSITNGKTILLIDDLYRSGATLKSITDILYEQGKAGTVYVLAATKTRSKT